jgi:hypothetical protein
MIFIITYNDDEDFSYKEIFFYNSDIDIEIHFDEFCYSDVDQVGIMNEIFDDINHIEKLEEEEKKRYFQWNFVLFNSFYLLFVRFHLTNDSLSIEHRFLDVHLKI